MVLIITCVKHAKRRAKMEYKMIDGKLHFHIDGGWPEWWVPCYPVLTINDDDYYPLPVAHNG